MNASRLAGRVSRAFASLLIPLVCMGVQAATSAKLDLDGDGKADILWFNAATGQTSTWLMNGTSFTAATVLLAHPDWKVIGTPDFNGDGKSDLLWYNAATGQTSTWLMNGTAIVATGLFLTDPNWKVIATADFNGDGKADLLWYNAATGQTSIWLMDGTTVLAATLLLTHPDWTVIATPDLNGDGKADLLWYNSLTGQTSAWLMSGTAVIATALQLTDLYWNVVGTADFNGDGKTDLLWYNATTGQTAIWLMDGLTASGTAVILTDPRWKVISTADFNGDGKADLLWYNPATGQTSSWLMNGMTPTSAAVLLSRTDWSVIGTPDLNGDGKADLLWYNASTGQTSVWLMNGTSALSASPILTNASWIARGFPAALPTIAVQPASVFALPPGTAAYAVNASSTEALKYQWQVSLDNGASYANILGATAATYAPSLNSADDGKLFRVIVSNSAGSVTSKPASYTVFVTTTNFGGTPLAIAFDSANTMYVSEAPLDVYFPYLLFYGVQKVSLAGVISAFAGAGVGVMTDGVGSAARFSVPAALAVDRNGNAYTTDSDGGAKASVIRRISPDGTVVTVAGGQAGYVDAVGSLSRFGSSPSGLATDSGGNLFVADSANNVIRKMTPGGVVSTFAGSRAGVAGFVNATGTAALFASPHGIAIDANDNLYVSDTNNSAIRKITPTGSVTTLAGGTFGFADATGSAARFLNPRGLAVDTGGNIYVADTQNNRIRKITSDGVVTTLAGNGVAGGFNGTGTAASFWNPSNVAVDASGNVYVVELVRRGIRKITPAGTVTVFVP